MNKIFTVAFAVFIFQCATAQDTLWRRNGIAALNLTQVALNNWAAGGQSSISGNTIFNYSANYLHKKLSWDNLVDLAFGGVAQDPDYRFLKTEDKIELTSKGGVKAFGDFYYSGLFNFRSQFAPGYNKPGDEDYISNFLAPAYITLAAGIDYKPNPYLSLYLSPATVRFVVVNDKHLSDLGAFGVEKGKKLRTEAGAYFRALYKKDVSKTVNLQSSLELFSDYTREPGNIDVNFQVLAAIKLGKYISLTASAQMLYDDDTRITFYKDDGKTIDRVGPGLQLKEVMGLGLSYKFSGVSVR